MSIATVVSRGFGSFGSVNLVPTRGYSPSLVIGGDSPAFDFGEVPVCRTVFVSALDRTIVVSAPDRTAKVKC